MNKQGISTDTKVRSTRYEDGVSEPIRVSAEAKDSSTPQDIYIESARETANAISLEHEGGYVPPIARKSNDPVSAKEVIGTVLAAPVYLLAGLLSLLGAGCGGNENKTEPDPPNPVEKSGFRYETADGHILIIEKGLIENNNVAPETIDYLKGQVDTCVQEVKDDLGIDPLWPFVRFRYLNETFNGPSWAAGSGANRSATLRMSDSKMGDINRDVLDGTRALGDDCSSKSAIHELNHALTMPPFSIYTKEGIAVYSESLWMERPKVLYDVSNLLVQGTYDASDIVWSAENESDGAVIDAMDPVTNMWVESIQDGKIGIGFHTASTDDDLFFIPYPVGECLMVKNILMCTEQLPSEDVVEMKIYDNVGLIDSYMVRKVCNEDSYESGFIYNLPERQIVARWQNAVKHLFSDYDMSNLTIDDPINFQAQYSIYYCFWNRIRRDHGTTAVKQIIGTMMDTAEDRLETDPGLKPFPFFDTVKEVTGMTEGETQSLFDIHQVPTEDASHRVGYPLEITTDIDGDGIVDLFDECPLDPDPECFR